MRNISKKQPKFEKITLEQWIADTEKESNQLQNPLNFANNYDNIVIPSVSSLGSVGFDISVPYDTVIKTNEINFVKTGICWNPELNEEYYENMKLNANSINFIPYLSIVVRSSMAKRGIYLANQIGIVDPDYYQFNDENGNIKNGHIMLPLRARDNDVEIKSGERLCQGIVQSAITWGYQETKERSGGFGSSGK